MSSFGTSSPVSASTLAYLIRCPVFRLSWLKEIFSDSEVAGYSATGHVTRDRRRKPFQFARGAMRTPYWGRLGFKTNGTAWFRHARQLIHAQPAAQRQRARAAWRLDST